MVWIKCFHQVQVDLTGGGEKSNKSIEPDSGANRIFTRVQTLVGGFHVRTVPYFNARAQSREAAKEAGNGVGESLCLNSED
jgi:hypothetical protein